MPPTSPAKTRRRLASSHVLVIGSGDLASAALDALAPAGIGTVSAVPDGIGTGEPDAPRFEPGRSFGLLLEVDVVVDASESAATRYLANDAAAIRGIPMVWGTTGGGLGRVGVAWDERGVDYRDAVPEGSADDPGPGDVPTLAAIVGEMIAAEVVKLLTATGDALIGRVAVYDPSTGRVAETAYRREPGAGRPGSLEERTAMREHDPARSVTPDELAVELEGPDAPLLLDVREPWEAALVSLPDAALIPLGELRGRIGELDPASPLVVYCHVGVRSGRALEILEQAGFTRARHLTGGVDAWAAKVDPSLPRY